MRKKILKAVFYLIIIAVLGGLSGVVFDHYVFPRLTASKYFSKYAFLKSFTEDVTLINKTEQVFVKEETSIEKISNQASSSVVNIVSFPKAASISVSDRDKLPDKPKNGTGIIVTSDGLVMTYVIAINPDSEKFKILTADRGYYDAEFLGTDSYSNLSFLKINANNLPAISFGNSDDASPGEKVVAVGNSSDDYSNRYASGLLSSFNSAYNLAGKSLSFSDKLEGVFETDFGFGDKYAGGPVIDYSGQAIGIFGTLEKNGVIESFQMPSNEAKRVIEKAIRKEISKNASLGIYYVPITKTYAESRNLPREKGALIYSYSGQQGLAIIAGSAGQRAGLQINDIITAVNGQEIDLKNALPRLIYQFKQGDRIELTVLRNGQELKLPVNL